MNRVRALGPDNKKNDLNKVIMWIYSNDMH